MIGTITLNPAIDKRYVVESVCFGQVNRVKSCCCTAGGKGLNVSRVARIAGEEVTAAGFAGGYAGAYILHELEVSGIRPLFVQTGGESRSCINLYDEKTGTQTELLEPGDLVTEREQEQLLRYVEQMAADCRVLVISGSSPYGIAPDYYRKLVHVGKQHGAKVLVDTNGEGLRESLKAGPFLIKPNRDELESLAGRTLKTEEQLIREAIHLYEKGAECAVVSLGKEGSLIVCSQGVLRVRVPQVSAVNSVGCGDSMIAGFAVGINRGYDWGHMIRYAAAVSVANAMQEQTGFIDLEDVERLMPEIVVSTEIKF